MIHPPLFVVKFIYFEKATKFCEIFTLLLAGTTQDKSKVKISQNFVAFSEYLNFNCQVDEISSQITNQGTHSFQYSAHKNFEFLEYIIFIPKAFLEVPRDFRSWHLKYLCINLFVTSKKTSPIHEFKVLKNVFKKVRLKMVFLSNR